MFGSAFHEMSGIPGCRPARTGRAAEESLVQRLTEELADTPPPAPAPLSQTDSDW